MSTDNKVVRLFPILHNIKPFLVKEHPEYHPATKDYEDYWEEHEKRCIEGLWGLDQNKDTKEGGWRYCPPQLYYYVNFCVIEDEDESNNSSEVIIPRLRDIEWVFFTNWLICRGFSGFADDDEYTSNILVYKLEQNINLNPKDKKRLSVAKHIYKKDGTYKKYIHPREYLYKTHEKPLGLPLYENTALNLLWLASRGIGKSFIAAALLSHTFKFHGATRFDNTYFDIKKGPEIVVGAALSSKSADLLKKFKFMEEYQKENFGAWGENDDFIPGFFFQNTLGTLVVNNNKSPYRAEYLYKEGGVEKVGGKGTKLIHVTYESNSEAAVGTRPMISEIEEVGLATNLLQMWASNETTLIRRNKFGSQLGTGCVCAGTKVWDKNGRLCNIEDITEQTGILSNKVNKTFAEKKIKLSTPKEKECFRITLEGGSTLECSWDHPLLTASQNIKYMKEGVIYRDAVFVRACDIVKNDNVFLMDKISAFGKLNEPYARTLGLLIGDGYYGQKNSISLCTDQKNIQNYISSTLDCKVKKQFLIQNGSEYFIEYGIKDKYLKEILINNGMMGQSRERKQFPLNIHEYNKESLASFIGGYFDSDGNISYNKKSKTIKIVLTAKYKHLLESTKYYLTKFGIDSTICKEYRKTGYAPGVIYKLYISKNKDVKTFIDNISLLSEYKQKALLDNYRKTISNKRYNVKVKNNEGEISDINNVIAKRVLNVEEIGLKIVYNLTTFGTNRYLANNIITHNTGGSMEKIEEPKVIFEDPDSYTCLGFDDLWENRKKPIGLFIPAYYQDDSFRDENGNQDIEKAYEVEMYERAIRGQADNSFALDGYMMARPLVPSEMFLSGQSNIFPIAMLRDQLNKVEIQELYETYSFKGELEWNKTKTGVILNVDINNRLKPILSTNLDGYKNNLKGCCVFYEAPEEKVPDPTQKRSLYKVVYDPYRDDGEGTSLASIIVYKGISENNWAEGLQDDIVAEYIGRLDRVDDVHEIAVQLAIYYNAKIMVETNIADFIRYCKREGWAYLLQAKPTDAIAAAVKNPGKKYDVGIDMTSPALQEQAEQLWRQWLLTEWKTLDNGVILYNLNKLKSPMILKQLIQYNRKGNFDHISSLKLLALWLSQERRVPIQQSSEVAKEGINTYFNKMQISKKSANINHNYYNY